MSSIADIGVNITADMSDFEKGVARVTENAKTMGKSLGEVGETISNSITAPLSEVGTVGAKAFDSLEGEVKDLEKALEDTGEAMGGINTTGSRMPTDVGSGVDKTSKKVVDLDKKLTSVGKSLSMTVTAPLVGVGVMGVKAFGDLETGVAKVGTMLNGTGKTMADVKEETKALSGEFATAQTELTEAMYQAISAGVEATETQDFLSVALKASKGGFTDTATAVDGLTSVLNSYGLETADAEKIANQMLITQNKGKTTFGELASSVAGVTPIASQLNVSTEELFSNLAVLTANGISTSQSVTGLKAVMSGIISPSSEATKMAEALGIEFNATAVQSEGLMPFLQGIGDKLRDSAPEYANCMDNLAGVTARMSELEGQGAKSSEEYKKLAKEQKILTQESELLATASESQIGGFASLFGSVEALNSVMVMTSEGGSALFNDTMKEMETNTGALDDAFNTMSETQGVTLQQAMVSLQNAMISVGEALAPMVSMVANGVSKMANAFANLSPVGQKVVVVLGGIIAIIPPLLITIGKTISAVKLMKTTMTALGGVSGIMTSVGGAFSSMGGVIMSAMTSLGGVIVSVCTTIGSAFMALLASPVTWIILGIMAIVAVGYLLWDNWDIVVAWCKEAWQSLSDFLGVLWEGIKNIFATAWEFIKSCISTGLEIVKGLFTIYVKVWFTIFETVWNAIKFVFETVWNAIKFVVTTYINAVKKVIEFYVNAIKTFISVAFNVIKTFIINPIKSAYETVSNVFGNIKNKIKSCIEGARDIVKNAIEKMKGFFKFEWSLPKLKLPHFSMSGEFSLNPPSIPKIGVDWYDKGGIFSSAQVIGVGEKRPEFVGALDDLKTLMREVLREEQGGESTGGVALNIETFYNNSEQDIEQLCKEIEFFRKRVSMGTGGR